MLEVFRGEVTLMCATYFQMVQQLLFTLKIFTIKKTGISKKGIISIFLSFGQSNQEVFRRVRVIPLIKY